MKFVARKPTCADRCSVKLLVPVAFDGNLVEAGGVVGVSDTQMLELIGRSLGIPEETAAATLVVRPRAVIEFADKGTTPCQRCKWHPVRHGKTRIAPRGSVRLDAGASIVEQVNRIVGR